MEINPQNNIPKYLQLKQFILDEIKQGKYTQNRKLPAIREMIRKYNISDITARRTIQELVTEGIAYTVPGKGCFLSDSAGDVNENIDKKEVTENRIPFILSTFVNNNFYNEVLKGALDVFQSKGYSLELYSTKTRYHEELKFLRRCINLPIAGLIIMPGRSRNKYRILSKYVEKKIPVVFVDNCVEGYNFDYVTSDNRGGAKNVVNYLIEQGHRKIICIEIAGDGECFTLTERVEGYKEALKENGIEINRDMIISLSTEKLMKPKMEDLEEMETNKRIIKEKISQFISAGVQFTAVFAVNDWIAETAVDILRDLGKRVPEDVSIGGFDDAAISIPRATARHDAYHLGYYGAKILLRKINNGKDSNINERALRKVIKTELIIRK